MAQIEAACVGAVGSAWALLCVSGICGSGNALLEVDQGAYIGGCSLPDDRVVFVRGLGHNLVVWEPGLGLHTGVTLRSQRFGTISREAQG